jgi:hypothetical protein
MTNGTGIPITNALERVVAPLIEQTVEKAIIMVGMVDEMRNGMVSLGLVAIGSQVVMVTERREIGISWTSQ